MSFARNEKLLGLARLGAGIGALGALFFFSKLDLSGLAVLANGPAALVCIALILTLLPIAALRWAILLRMLGFDIPFNKLYHVVAITNFLHVFFIGPLGGDLSRGIYIWRIVGRGTANVASSIVIDRLLGLFAAFGIALSYLIFNWSWIRDVPALLALATSILLGFCGMLAGAGVVLLAPAALARARRHLSGWPRASSLLGWAHDTAGLMRHHPAALSSVLGLALLSQLVAVIAVMVVGTALEVATLSPADYLLAVPVTVAANALPITPNGLGIGEAAFDQICRWVAGPSPTVAYANIFFAFRILGLAASLSGLVSLFMYRNSAGTGPGTAGPLGTHEA